MQVLNAVENNNKTNGFYQLSNTILSKFTCKDVDAIRFNHYIMRKENAQRLKNDLPRGQFYLTVRTASNDLNLSFAKAQRLIRKFVELGIIDDIFKAWHNNRKSSIYQYNVAVINESINNTECDTEESNNTKGIDVISDTLSDTSKKEYIKRKNKRYKEKKYKTSLDNSSKDTMYKKVEISSVKEGSFSTNIF